MSVGWMSSLPRACQRSRLSSLRPSRLPPTGRRATAVVTAVTSSDSDYNGEDEGEQSEPATEKAADAIAQHALADLHDLLVRQPADLAALLHNVSEAQGQATYAPGKWTLAESLVHTIDTERVFAYRLLRAARGRELRVMFPLIASVDEVTRARGLVDPECDWARRRGWGTRPRPPAR